MFRQIRRLSRHVKADVQSGLNTAFEDGKNRYRNRGILRATYASAAAVPAVGLGLLTQAAGASVAETSEIVALPAAVAFDQAVAAYGNLSGNYKTYGLKKRASARELSWFKNRQAALGLGLS